MYSVNLTAGCKVQHLARLFPRVAILVGIILTLKQANLQNKTIKHKTCQKLKLPSLTSGLTTGVCQDFKLYVFMCLMSFRQINSTVGTCNGFLIVQTFTFTNNPYDKFKNGKKQKNVHNKTAVINHCFIIAVSFLEYPKVNFFNFCHTSSHIKYL